MQQHNVATFNIPDENTTDMAQCKGGAQYESQCIIGKQYKQMRLIEFQR